MSTKADLEAAVGNLQRALDTLIAGDDAIVHATDETELVQRMCRAIVEDGGYWFAWVGYAEQDAEKSVRPVAQWGASRGYPELVKFSWADGPLGAGPGGTAIRTGRPVGINDMLADPRYEPWRDQALKFGHRSGLAVPIRVRGEVIGVLGIYSEVPAAFDDASREVLVRLGEHLGFGIEKLRDGVLLARGSALYRGLVEGLPGYFYTVRADSPTRATYLSPQIKLMLGYSAQELLASSTPWTELIHPDDRDAVVTEFVAATQRSRSFELEYRVVDREGVIHWVRDHAIGVPDPAGGPNLWQGIVLDVTSSRHTEDESANISKFLAVTSHELRTPLNSVIGFADLLADPHFGPLTERQSRYVTNIRSAGAQLLAIINDVLDLSKAKANRFDLRPELIDGRSSLSAAVEQIASMASSAGIDVFLLPGGPAPMLADSRAVRQILLNMLSNAIKFTPSGGSITLAATVMDDQSVDLSVTDTGRGIPAADLESVFDEYRQVGAQQGDSRGTGLGLALSRRLAQLMSGTLTVESEVGAGSTFTLSLPGRSAP
jgi:PAS domain S-box-containing protein